MSIEDDAIQDLESMDADRWIATHGRRLAASLRLARESRSVIASTAGAQLAAIMEVQRSLIAIDLAIIEFSRETGWRPYGVTPSGMTPRTANLLSLTADHVERSRQTLSDALPKRSVPRMTRSSSASDAASSLEALRNLVPEAATQEERQRFFDAVGALQRRMIRKVYGSDDEPTN